MIGVRKKGRIRVAELEELQNPSPFRVRRGSLYLVHTFAATSRLSHRYSVLCVQNLYNLYKLDVTTLDSRNIYTHDISFIYSLSIHLSVYSNLWFQSYFVGNDIEHRSTTSSSMILLLVKLIYPNVKDSISIIYIS